MAKSPRSGASQRQARSAKAKPPVRGASVKSKPPGRAPFKAAIWLSHHQDAALNAVGRLIRQPVSALMTLLVIGIALALPASLHLLVQNARLVSGEWANAVDLSVYLTPGTSEADITLVKETIEANEQVGGIILLSAADALRDFTSLSGFGKALEALDNNPLPATIIVRPNALDDEPEQVARLAEQLRSLPNVDLVQLDTEWVERFHGMLNVIRRAVAVAATLLALAVLIIVGNSIRMEIQQRRDEIEVTKLVGGSDAFIRRPFVYTGIWFGLLGGIIATLLVTSAVALMSEPVSRVAGLYGSQFRLTGLTDFQWLWLIGLATLLGAIGSWSAASRHLKAIEPT